MKSPRESVAPDMTYVHAVAPLGTRGFSSPVQADTRVQSRGPLPWPGRIPLMNRAVVRHPGIYVSSVALAVLLSACGGAKSSATPGSVAPSKSAPASAASVGSAAFCAEVKSQAAALRGTE